jgi:hypothetical protein
VALSPDKALEAAKNVMGARRAEADRLNFIAGALNPSRFRHELVAGRTNEGTYKQYGQPTVELPKNATPTLQRLAWKARTNFLPLVLDTFSQVMKVDGYPTAKTDVEGGPWGTRGRRTSWTPARPACTALRSPTAPPTPP